MRGGRSRLRRGAGALGILAAAGSALAALAAVADQSAPASLLCYPARTTSTRSGSPPARLCVGITPNDDAPPSARVLYRANGPPAPEADVLASDRFGEIAVVLGGAARPLIAVDAGGKPEARCHPVRRLHRWSRGASRRVQLDEHTTVRVRRPVAVCPAASPDVAGLVCYSARARPLPVPANEVITLALGDRGRILRRRVQLCVPAVVTESPKRGGGRMPTALDVFGDVVIGSNTTWPEGVHDADSITILSGATLTLTGGSTVNVEGTIDVQAGGTLLLAGKDTSAQVGGLWVGTGVTVNAGDVTVAAGGHISADAQGYAGAVTGTGAGPGGGGAIASQSAGGGYGGAGGSTPSATGGGTYGDPGMPTDLGSGGGGDTDDSPAGMGGNGGGALTLVVDATLTLDGTITADGGAGTANEKGGGAGGSLRVQTDTLTGSGRFSADGGAGGGNQAAAGGGGRIVVSYASDGAFGGFATSTASGGTGNGNGTAGTVAFFDTSDGAHLRVIGARFEIPADSPRTFSDLTLESAATLVVGGGSTIEVEGTIDVQSGSTLVLQGKNTSAQVSGTWQGAGVALSAFDVVVAAGGRISADGQGYDGGVGGAGKGPGGGGSTNAQSGGGGYGGAGGSTGGAAGGSTYGSPTMPTDLGSGGGGDTDDSPAGRGGNGGGAISLTVTNLLALDGTIGADGGTGVANEKGGGAGGSVLVQTGAIGGAGRFSADGGAGTSFGAGGGGGRIAVSYASDDGFGGFAASTASGGSGAASGAPGTVAFFDIGAGNHLRVVGGLFEIAAGSSPVFSAMTLESGATVIVGGGATVEVDGTLALRDASTLLLRSTNTNAASGGVGVTINAVDASVEAGSHISADGQGYLGAVTGTGSGPGGGGAINSGSGGGGHGGLGGTLGGQGGVVYDSPTTPTDLGSGGGGDTDNTPVGQGGNGGGAIDLSVSGTLALAGTITADGDDGSAHEKGGGAGGSIRVHAGTLAGSGHFSADGGAGGGGAGGGGGGRLAIHYVADAGFGGFAASTTAGGGGGSAGAAGTVAFVDTSLADAHLHVFRDNFTIANDTAVTWGAVTLDGPAVMTLGGGVALGVRAGFTLANGALVVAQATNRDGGSGGSGVSIHAGSLTLESGTAISADAQGYTGASLGTGNGPAGGGATFGFAGGGGHGGSGASLTNAPGGGTYDVPDSPSDLGSGGGGDTDNSPPGFGGAGGGALAIVVDGTLALDGTISADGGAGTNSEKGGGAGGSLYVQAGTLAGAGQFTADGGNGGGSGGGGGGGRVAVYYETDDGFTGFALSSAQGGTGAVTGTAGTIALVDLSVDGGHLRIPAARYDVAPDTALSFGQVTVDGGGRLELGGGSTLQVAGAFAVETGATVLVQGKERTGLSGGAGATIVADTLSVDAGATMTADGQGYVGATTGTGRGPGAGTAIDNAFAGGGGYGGMGGDPLPGTGGPVYGSRTLPRDLGSGGGGGLDDNPNGSGGAGGGAIALAVRGLLTIDGTITAGGAGGAVNEKGGGAGGSILIGAGTIAGSGNVTANGGGGGGSQGGGGGGGRIALHSEGNISLPLDHLQAAAGIALFDGDAGTVFVGETTVYAWLDGYTLFHDTRQIRWAALGLDQAGVTVDIQLFAGAPVATIATGLPSVGSLAWDTRTVADGSYELQAIFRASGGVVLGQAVRRILLNNSVAWHGGRLTADETWPASIVHVVEADVIVPAGVHLTIAAGAVVKFADGARIVVEAGGILDVLADVTLTGLADDSASGDTNLDGNASASRPGAWGGVTGSGTINLDPAAEFRWATLEHGGTLAADETWASGFVHRVRSALTIPAGRTLTVQSGAVVKLDHLQEITVQGALMAEGALAQPVTFTSIRDDAAGGDTNRDGDNTTPAAGDWRWLYVSGGHLDLAHTLLAYGAGTVNGQWNGTGAVRADGPATVDIANSTVRDMFFDGILIAGGTANVESSVVVATDRGIGAHPGGTLRVANCTVDDNRIGILAHGGTLDVLNTLVTNSHEFGILHDNGQDVQSVGNTDVWSPTGTDYSGTTDRSGQNGNVSVDPRYVSAENGDYRLGFGSPVIDAADGATAPATDFTGAPRYDDPRTSNTGTAAGNSGIPDIGAFEFVETAPSPIDLVVADVTGPLAVIPDQTVTVRWTVRNLGSGAARGAWHDAIALVGELRAVPRVLVAREVASQGVVGPGGELSFEATVVVPSGADGIYHWQVRTNSRGEIFEGANSGNNDGRSAATVTLTLPQLPIGGSVNVTLSTIGRGVLVRLDPDAGGDVVIQADREDASGWTQLFVACGDAPTPERFEARSMQFNQPDASITIGNPPGGPCYLLVLPRSLPNGAVDVTLTAADAAFALDGLDLQSGANVGRVTIGLRGAGFRPDATAALIAPGDTPHAAVAVYFADPTSLFATFDLNGLTPGAYDVRVGLDATTRTLADAFAVAGGQAGRLDTHVLMPVRVRVSRVFTAWIEYQNVGATDLYAPFVKVTSPAGSLMSLDPTGPFTRTTAAFQAIGNDGPAGVLRPGQRGRVPVHVLARSGSNALRTRIGTERDTSAMNWTALKTQVRPPGPPAGWDAVWDGIVAAAGPTVGDFVRTLAGAATLRAVRTGERTYDALENLRCLVFEALADAATTLSGRVHRGDPSHPLAGARVSAVNENTGETFVAVSGTDGLVRFANLPPGTYRLFVEGDLVDGDSNVVVVPAGADIALDALRGGRIVGRVIAPPDVSLATGDGFAVIAVDARGLHYRGALASNGRYAVEGVNAGTYDVLFSADESGLVAGRVHGVAVTAGETSVAPDLVVSSGGSITGTVTDGTDPVEGASVGVVAGTGFGRGAVTDADGLYRLDGVPPGEQQVSASAPGFLRQSVASVQVVSLATTSGVDLALTAEATLSGQVTMGGVTPVAGAIVELTLGTDAVASATTDANGAYTVDRLGAGSYTLTVDHARYEVFSTGVVLSAGSPSQADADLTLAARVHGVVQRAGMPVAALLLRLVAPDGSTDDQPTAADGSFAFTRLDDGDYTLMLADGSERHPFTVAGASTDIDVPITLTAGSVRGRVVASAGGLFGGSVTVSLLAQGARVIGDAVDPDGGFAFPLVAPGTYSLELTSPDAFFAEAGSITVSDGIETVVPDMNAGSVPLTVTVSHTGPLDPAGFVSVRRLAGAAPAQPGRLADLPGSAMVTVSGLVPGDYLVETIVPSVSNVAERVTVAGATPVTVTVDAAAEISGVVRTALGAPIEGISVRAYDAADPARAWNATSAADGSYATAPLPAGTYTVVAADRRLTRPGQAFAPGRQAGIVVTAGSVVAQDFALVPSTIFVSGHVVDAGGSSPLVAEVRAIDADGVVVDAATVDAAGAWALRALGAETVDIVAVASGFSVVPRALTPDPGDFLTGFDLDATWVAALPLPLPPPAAGLPGTPGLSLNPQSLVNGLRDGLRNVLGEPHDDAGQLTYPPIPNDCPCPEALAWKRQAVQWEIWKNQFFEAWVQRWEGAVDVLAADSGLLAVSSLKLLTGLWAASVQVTGPWTGQFQQSQAELLTRAQQAYRSGTAAGAREFEQLRGDISALESLHRGLMRTLAETGATVAGSYGTGTQVIQKNAGVPGVTTDFNVGAIMDHIATAPTWTHKDWITFAKEVNGLAATLQTLSNLVTTLGARLPTIGGPLGTLGDALQVTLDAIQAIEDVISTINDLAEKEELYKNAAERRDDAYRRMLRALGDCARSCDEEPPDDPDPPAPPDDLFDDGDDGDSDGVGSYDPNDKQTVGLGTAGYVEAGETLIYTIHFENQASATAPAQRVLVTDLLSAQLDLSTLELVDVAFNGTQLSVPPAQQVFTAMTSVVSDPNPVRVDAGLDIGSQTLTFTVTSEDPVTGDPPADPLAGFLPPNDGTGRGEGHVTFLVKPRADLPEGTVINNQARIVFDQNAPIDTAPATNMIDSFAPDSAVQLGGTGACAATIELTWSGTDVASGIRAYTIFVSENGGAFAPLLADTTQTTATFAQTTGTSYAFYSIAVDNAGHVEAAPGTPDLQTDRAACCQSDAACDDGDPCTDDTCNPEEGCRHEARTCFASATCALSGTLRPAACAADPAKLVGKVEKLATAARAKMDAGQQATQASKCKLKKVQKQLKVAGKKLKAAGKAVAKGRAKKRKGLSAECGAALQAVLDGANARLGTLGTQTGECAPGCR